MKLWKAEHDAPKGFSITCSVWVPNHYTSSSVEIEEIYVSKNLDVTVRFQSEKKKEWIREVRGERLQGIAEGMSSASRLAISSAVSFPGGISVRGLIVA